MSMSRVFPCVVGKGCFLWPVHSLGKTLLDFALLHFVLQGQTCLLLQVSLDFLLCFSVLSLYLAYFSKYVLNVYLCSQCILYWCYQMELSVKKIICNIMSIIAALATYCYWTLEMWQSNWGTKFSILTNLNLNSYMWLVTSLLNLSVYMWGI